MSGLIAAAFADWRECRNEYDRVLYAAYDRAAEATRGALLNEDARKAGIDSLSLFMGPEARARRWASPELLEHWEHFPRVTYAEFERQWAASHEPTKAKL